MKEPTEEYIYYVLFDQRTNKYFGGGRADQLFTHWVTKAENAKRYRQRELMLDTLRQLYIRTTQNPLCEANQLILTELPHFVPEAFQIQQFNDSNMVSSDSILQLLESMTPPEPQGQQK